MIEVGVHAATDITGFGLAGHAREMAHGSGCACEIDLASVPVWPKVVEYAEAMIRPGRTADVVAYLHRYVDWGDAGFTWKGILADPQTSGGLMMAVAPEKADALIAALEARGEEAVIVGRMAEGEAGTIRIV